MKKALTEERFEQYTMVSNGLFGKVNYVRYVLRIKFFY